MGRRKASLSDNLDGTAPSGAVFFFLLTYWITEEIDNVFENSGWIASSQSFVIIAIFKYSFTCLTLTNVH